jgi:hypothetical protein
LRDSARWLRHLTLSAPDIAGTGVEHLWSQAGATGGNRSQMGHPWKRAKQADRQPVATHGTGLGAHGKEGSTVRVRQRASTKDLQIWISCRRNSKQGD